MRNTINCLPESITEYHNFSFVHMRMGTDKRESINAYNFNVLRYFMYPSVKNVIANNNYELVIDFDNGESGILDMKPFLDIGVFKRIKKLEAFKKVRVSFDTVEWDSGVDLDPEFVYAKCLGK